MKKTNLNNIDWIEIQEKHNSGVYWNALPKIFGISKTVFERALDEGYVTKKLHIRTQSDEAKNNISIGRSKYLKENPDKHPWKKNSKFKSVPCEEFKKLLNENKILFIEEYQPSDDRFYSIDIAFPNKKIGIEINGNQHYNKDGTLKEYYLNRNKYLNEIGWKIIDIHYSLIYNSTLVNDFISTIQNNSLSPIEFQQYSEKYFNRKKEKKNFKALKIEEKKKIKTEKIEVIKINLLSSGIDYTKFGWVLKAAKIIGCNAVKVNSWMKINMVEFYENNCFKKQKRITKYCSCGKEICFESKRCDICNKFNSRKVNRPSIEVLLNEISIIGITKTAKKYGVSRSAIGGWIGRK